MPELLIADGWLTRPAHTPGDGHQVRQIGDGLLAPPGPRGGTPTAIRATTDLATTAALTGPAAVGDTATVSSTATPAARGDLADESVARSTAAHDVEASTADGAPIRSDAALTTAAALVDWTATAGAASTAAADALVDQATAAGNATLTTDGSLTPLGADATLRGTAALIADGTLSDAVLLAGGTARSAPAAIGDLTDLQTTGDPGARETLAATTGLWSAATVTASAAAFDTTATRPPVVTVGATILEPGTPLIVRPPVARTETVEPATPGTIARFDLRVPVGRAVRLALADDRRRLTLRLYRPDPAPPPVVVQPQDAARGPTPAGSD